MLLAAAEAVCKPPPTWTEVAQTAIEVGVAVAAIFFIYLIIRRTT